MLQRPHHIISCFLQDQAMKICQHPTIVKFINFSPLCNGSNAMAKIQKQEVNHNYITHWLKLLSQLTNCPYTCVFPTVPQTWLSGQVKVHFTFYNKSVTILSVTEHATCNSATCSIYRMPWLFDRILIPITAVMMLAVKIQRKASFSFCLIRRKNTHWYSSPQSVGA